MTPQHACESLAPNLRSIYILLFPSLFISPNFHFSLSLLLTPPKPPYLSSKTWQHIWIYLFALLHLSSFFSDLHHSSYSSNLKKVYKIWLFIPHTLLWFLDYLSVANTKKTPLWWHRSRFYIFLSTSLQAQFIQLLCFLLC